MDYSSSGTTSDPNIIADVDEHCLQSSSSEISSTESDDPQSASSSSTDNRMRYGMQSDSGNYSPFESDS